jgi:hypothetical protein
VPPEVPLSSTIAWQLSHGSSRQSVSSLLDPYFISCIIGTKFVDHADKKVTARRIHSGKLKRIEKIEKVDAIHKALGVQVKPS